MHAPEDSGKTEVECIPNALLFQLFTTDHHFSVRERNLKESPKYMSEALALSAPSPLRLYLEISKQPLEWDSGGSWKASTFKDLWISEEMARGSPDAEIHRRSYYTSRKQNCCIFGLSLFCPSLSRLQSAEEIREEDGTKDKRRQLTCWRSYCWLGKT